MSNIFTSENITKYSKNASDLNSGNWTTRNDIPVISISPYMLYYGSDTEENINKTNGKIRKNSLLYTDVKSWENNT